MSGVTTESVTRKINVETLTRVEGEGGIRARIVDGHVAEVAVNIFEPPRLFEALLIGRHYDEVPDIVARICGICPVAHQMSSVHALEKALGISVTPEIRAVRRLMYCAEWIESHALHIYLLQAPDFLGFESAITLAAAHPELVEKGLRLKKIGNDVLTVLGGRAIHPVSVCVGGFYRMPRKRELLRLRNDLMWALGAAKETVETVAQFEFPPFEVAYEFVALTHPHEYPMNEGVIETSEGLSVDVEQFESHFLEEHVARSTALHSVRAESGTSYFVGPLARINLNFDRLMPQAKEAAVRSGLSWPCCNPFMGIVARAVELVHACEEALSIIDSYHQPEVCRIAAVARVGEGCAATEAPRGILYHRCRIDDDGLVEAAKIVPPTSQNLRRMEDDLDLLIDAVQDRSDDAIARECERLIRSYDPCISCSTHFLRLQLVRE